MVPCAIRMSTYVCCIIIKPVFLRSRFCPNIIYKRKFLINDCTLTENLKSSDNMFSSIMQYQVPYFPNSRQSITEEQLLHGLLTQLEISVYSPHILYIIFTYYLVRFWNSNFMYEMCTRRVECLYKRKNYTYFVYTLHISYVFVYLWTRILTGLEPTTFILPFHFA